ncbi:retrovirus-related pol polyprotein from transposon TNT 1-94 [Tanacetum coccineum]
MLFYLAGMERYYLKYIKDGPFQPKIAEGDDKPESQWTPDERTVVVHSFEGPSDIKENTIMDLKLEYQTFKGLRNVNHTQTLDLADIYGRFVYEDNLIQRRYSDTKKALITTPSSTAISTAFFSNNVMQDFQENSDDEVDERSSEEYLGDLDINQADPKVQKDYKAEYKKMKAKLALLEANPSTSQTSKTFQPKNKGLVAETFDWDKEEVSDDEEVTQVKVLMDLEMVPKSKDWVERLNPDSKLPNFNTRRVLVPESQAVNGSLKPIDTSITPKLSKDSKAKFPIPLHPLKNLQGASPSSERHIREPIWYQDNGCSRSMTGVKSYLHKFVEKPGPKQGTIFNANKEIVLITPRRNDVYVLDMSSLTLNGACFLAKASESINLLWHIRLSHLNFKNINKLAKQNKGLGLLSLVYSKDKPCSACEKGKHHRASFKTKQNLSIKKCLHLFHIDLFGLVSPMFINHKKYTLVIVDEYSRNFSELLLSLSEQNGVAKKKNKTLIEAARTMLNGSVLSIHFWTEVVRIVCKFDAKADDGYFLGYSFVLKAFRVFNTRRQQVEETYHVTFDESLEAIRFTNTSENEIGIDDSSIYPLDEFINEDDLSRQYQTDFDISDYVIPHGCSLFELTKENHVPEVIAPNEPDIPLTEDTEGPPDLIKTKRTHEQNVQNEQTITQPTEGPSGNNTEVSDRWSKYQHIKLVNIIGDPGEGMLTRSMAAKLIAASTSECLFADFLSKIEPKKVFEVLKHPGWVDVMQEELNQFYRNKVWTLVLLFYGKTTIGSKWVFRNKKDKHGITTKNKARLVVQGYSQEEGIDYDETFAPVVRIEAIRIFLAFATYMNFKVYQIDVKSAFLNGKLIKEVYVKQPPGFESSEFPDYVCKLDKALYGLKQAPKACMMGELTYFLGLQIKKDEKGISICQEQYIRNLLKKYKISNSSLVKTPIVPPNNLDPDLAGKPSNPKESLLTAVKRILKYLKGTPTLGLCYPKCLGFDLKGYSDSDYAWCNKDRKSTSAKAEYVTAAAGCCASTLWMKSQLNNYDIHYKLVPIFCNNTSAIAISSNLVLHSRTKHIDIRYHFIRDYILKGDIELHFIPTEYQLADIFTKPLDEPTFTKLKAELGMLNIDLSVSLIKHLPGQKPSPEELFSCGLENSVHFCDSVSSGTVPDLQDPKRNIQLVGTGLPSTLDEHTRKSQPLLEGTTTDPKDSTGNVQPANKGFPSTASNEGMAKSTSCPEGTLGDKYSEGNKPPVDMKPINPTIADPLGTGAEYQVDETQSTRLRDSIEGYYKENIAHRDQTDKLVEAFMSSLDKSRIATIDLYKGLNIITELLKYIKNAVKDYHVLNKKVIEATEAHTKNSSAITKLLNLVKNFDFQGLKSLVESLQAAALRHDEYLASWAKSSTSLAWNLGPRMTAVEKPPSQTKGEHVAMEDDKVEEEPTREVSLIEPSSKPPLTDPILEILVPRREGKAIATDDQPEVQPKLVPASKESAS